MGGRRDPERAAAPSEPGKTREGGARLAEGTRQAPRAVRTRQMEGCGDLLRAGGALRPRAMRSEPRAAASRPEAAGSRPARERTAGGAERRCGRYGEGSEGGSGRARYARDTGGAGQGAIRSEARTAVAAASAPDESDTERAAERYM